MPIAKNPCRYCGYELPARTPGQRGRPIVTHAGSCRRLYTNRVNLLYRIERFKAAHRLLADRSDIGKNIHQSYDFDEIADGYSAMYVDPYRNVWGAALMPLIEQWEADERVRKTSMRLFYESEKRLTPATPNNPPSAFDLLGAAEQAVELQRLVSNRQARRG